MPDPVLAEDVVTVLDRQIADASGRLLVVDPDAATVAATVDILRERPAAPPVAVLATDDRLKAAMGDFLVASRAADLVAADRLALATLDDPSNQSLVVGQETVVALVDVGDGVGALRTTDESFVAAARDHYGRRRETARPFDLRTPPLGRVRETMGEALGEQAAADFDAVLDTIERAPESGAVDEVAIALLVAARNRQLLYDVSKWGEDVGLASKATFSRTKTDLEEAGLLATEKVPIEVGRPRLRLLLGDERLSSAAPGEMVIQARQRMAE